MSFAKNKGNQKKDSLSSMFALTKQNKQRTPDKKEDDKNNDTLFFSFKPAQKRRSFTMRNKDNPKRDTKFL